MPLLSKYGLDPSVGDTELEELLETTARSCLPHLALFSHELRHDVLVVYGRSLCYRDLIAVMRAVYPRYHEGRPYPGLKGGLAPPSLPSQHPPPFLINIAADAAKGTKASLANASEQLVKSRRLAMRRLLFSQS
jgi:hypothetical protein